MAKKRKEKPKKEARIKVAEKSTPVKKDSAAAATTSRPARKIKYLENDAVFAKAHGYNPILLSKIQPLGNMSFRHLKYTQIGSY